jgi:dolichyl-phosphate beta-glucosyltransferase
MFTSRPYLSIIIPAYNEAQCLPGNLPEVFAFLRRQSYPAEVIVVDDGSEDRTASIVESLQPDHSNLRLIRNPHSGKAYTVRTGVQAARGEIVFQCDADLSMPIADLPKLLEPVQEGYDVAIASRWRRYHFPWYRWLMSATYHGLVSLLAVRGIKDTQCGFKCYRSEAAQQLFDLSLLYREPGNALKGPAVTGFDVELLYLAQRLGYRIKEVPVEWYYFEATSVRPIRDSWRNLRDLIRIRLNDRQGQYRYASAAKGSMRGSAPNE